MKIKPFKIVVTASESEIVQNILFKKHGFAWIDGIQRVSFVDSSYLIFKEIFFSNPTFALTTVSFESHYQSNLKRIDLQEFISIFGEL
jgi:hypothetical protein